MAWRPHSRASVNPRSPRAWGACDRCDDIYLLDDLQWQYQYQGNELVNLRLLVCEKCLDIPQQQLRTIVLPPDPVPVFNPRPFDYIEANSDYRITQDGDQRITQDGNDRVTQENGDDMSLEVP